MAAHRTLYEDDAVIVTTNEIASDTAVFTFSAWTKSPPAPVFGGEFVTKNAAKGVFFQNKRNDWWHNESMPKAIDAALSSAYGAKNKLSFGSSMGAYGAIVFARRLGCSNVVAISPQASIDRSIVPWETRWSEEAEVCTPNPVVAGDGLDATSTIHLLYDPLFKLDASHVKVIVDRSVRSGAQIVEWTFPLSGHPSGLALAQLHQLSGLVAGIFTGTHNRKQAQRDFRAKRAGSHAVAQTLMTNREIISRHPTLALRAVKSIQRQSRFDEKLTKLMERLQGIADKSKIR